MNIQHEWGDQTAWFVAGIWIISIVQGCYKRMWFDKRLPILLRVANIHMSTWTMSDQTAVHCSYQGLVPLKVWCLKSAKVVVPIKVATSCFKLTLYYMETREIFWDWHQTYCWMNLHLDPKSQAVKLPERLPSKIAPIPAVGKLWHTEPCAMGCHCLPDCVDDRRHFEDIFWFLTRRTVHAMHETWKVQRCKCFLLWMSNTLF